MLPLTPPEWDIAMFWYYKDVSDLVSTKFEIKKTNDKKNLLTLVIHGTSKHNCSYSGKRVCKEIIS